jgi:hypothetical protein
MRDDVNRCRAAPIRLLQYTVFGSREKLPGRRSDYETAGCNPR